MDNISHAVFGASIIQAFRWKKYGRKATTFALFAANIPDIDFIVRLIPGVSAIDAWLFHRTMTHSFLFMFLVAPLLWLVMSRIYKTGKGSWKDWTGISLVAIASHIFLDRCTTYGVRFLRPFTTMWFEANVINVVDLFFTLPLIGIVAYYLFGPSERAASRVVRWIGIVFALGYLGGMTYIHQRATAAIARDMQQSQTAYTSIFVTPTFLQPFLHYGVVHLAAWWYKTTYLSAFDTTPRVYQAVPAYHGCTPVLTKDSRSSDILRRTRWFYTCQAQGSTYKVTDLRFWRLIGWDPTFPSQYMFSYIIDPTQTPYRVTRDNNPWLPVMFEELRKRHRERVRWKK